jgi:hypothetical protein
MSNAIVFAATFSASVMVSLSSGAQQSTLPKCRDTQAQCLAKWVSDGYTKTDATAYCLRRKCITK